jgi:hypothetical protein
MAFRHKQKLLISSIALKMKALQSALDQTLGSFGEPILDPFTGTGELLSHTSCADILIVYCSVQGRSFT